MNGILFRNAEAVEKLRDVDTLVVDKTGTLTLGRPQLVDLVVRGIDEATAPALVASVERASEHPLAQAMVEARAGARHPSSPPVQDFFIATGQGVVGSVGGRQVAVGSTRFMQAAGIPHSLLGSADALRAQGKTVIFAAVDGRVAAVIAVADPIKETTPEAVAALKALGVRW